jgi:hypothetical protein
MRGGTPATLPARVGTSGRGRPRSGSPDAARGRDDSYHRLPLCGRIFLALAAVSLTDGDRAAGAAPLFEVTLVVLLGTVER